MTNNREPIGMYRNMPAETYHADAGVSNSMLSAMAKSPAHCWALYLSPDRPEREPTPAMLAGTLAHTAILEPATMASRYVVRPEGLDMRTKEGKAWRESIGDGVTIITADQAAAAESQRAAVLSVPYLRDLLARGDAEVSLFWGDAETNLRCRARPDWLHPTGQRSVIALDIKTTSDITLDGITRAVTTYGYHRQAAHYRNGLRACGMDVEVFVFAFVSASYPFLAGAFVLDDESLQQGEQEVAELLDRFGECLATNRWPAFGDGLQVVGLSKWARRSQEVEVSFVE